MKALEPQGKKNQISWKLVSADLPQQAAFLSYEM